MWNNDMTIMLVKESFTTLYMTLGSTILGYLLGLPLGIILVITAKNGLKPNAGVFKDRKSVG